jgi:Fic family protein
MIGTGEWVTRPYFGLNGRYEEYSAFVPGPIALTQPSFAAAGPLNELIAAEVALRVWSAASLEPPLEALLSRLEAVSSCAFEGINASPRSITEAFANPGRVRDENRRLILGNAAALERAVRAGARADSFTVDDLLALHADVLAGTRSFGGRVRTEAVWIGGSSPAHAVFVPPPAEYVMGLLEDLAAFVRRTDLPVLWQAAVAHAQFETIHPFIDGNGRTGRVLIGLIIAADGLRLPPFSAICLAHPTAYIEALNDYRNGRVDRTISSLCSGLRDAVDRAAAVASDLATATSDLRAQMGRVRAGSTVDRALPYLVATPLVEVGGLAADLGVSYPAASNAIEALVARGVLVSENDNARMRRWRCPRGETLVRRLGA